MGAVIETERQWTLVTAALAIPRPLGIACAVFGLLALFGYFGQVEDLYRPIAEGPATNPLTAVTMLLLGLGIKANDRTQRGIWLERACAVMAIWIAISRLVELSLGADLTSYLTPFHEQVVQDHLLAKNNSMGINTAFMMLSIAIALWFHSFQLPMLSQMTASIAVAIPAVSFTGYGYGLVNFYGQMSLLTATAGFGLACATLALTADHAGLKAILSPYIAGRIARVQVFAGYLMPTGFGYILVQSFVAGSEQNQSLFGIFVVAICWFIILMVSISAIFHEKADFARRHGEARLAAAAMSDALTGLPNRRNFFETGQREVERIKRIGSELWVLMIDLDHFKSINDTAGHAIGDRVLVAVAELLSSSIRKVDLVGRLGGEEFSVLVTDTTQEGCARVAENIRQNIASLAIEGWTNLHGPVTASIGCARLSQNDTLEAALLAADDALYRAKDGGRNQVAFSIGTPDS